MLNRFIFTVTLLLFVNILSAQEKLPSIRAKSYLVDVRDGDSFKKGDWKISPDAKPDIYITSAKGKKVTFYTDMDSISVKITTSTKFDFIILLNDSVKAFTEILYKPGYLDILKTAGSYNINDNRYFPKFTYQLKDDPDLVALRTGFKLDSIAGGGNQVSKILNLLLWVHNLIPHDGDHDNPVIKNALSLISVCKRENRGLNCRGLATVLNECYLSLGIPSRIVTCMPKDSIFNDCHVINMVYVKDLKKWIWIDPTNYAYVMNEKGDLLSIEEVRDRIIHDKLVILNPDANWNHKDTKTKEVYLFQYMAKNLFRMQCPIESRYDNETWNKGKVMSYVELLSMNGYSQVPQKVSTSQSGMTVNYYKTNNPVLFWALPE